MSQDRGRLHRLAEIVQCVRCRGACRAVTDRAGLACSGCDAFYPLTDDVLVMSAESERPEVLAEQEAVRLTEHSAALGGIDEAFDDLAKATGPLREALLSLPGGNGSRYYAEPGYFMNVKSSERGFDFVRDRLKAEPGQRLLDVGADFTWSTNAFARAGLRCTALDINHHLSIGSLFQAHYGAPYDMVRADMSLPVFRPGAFDIIVAFNALHHGGDLDRLLANLTGLLNAGGRLAAVEPYSISAEHKEAFGRAQIEAGINERTYMLDEWHGAFRRAGLELVEVMVSHACCMIFRRAGSAALPAPQTTMLENAYRGRLVVQSIAQTLVRRFVVHVDIVNAGNATWCSEGSLPIFASYHLFKRERGQVTEVAFDNRRTPIPDVRPGSTTRCGVVVDLPDEPAAYEVRFDLVQEGLCWFEERGFGGATARLP
jgi:SAM-dependent methyltransferase